MQVSPCFDTTFCGVLTCLRGSCIRRVVMPVSLNEFWWAAMVQASLTVPTSLCSFLVFMSDPQQPTGAALSAVRAESLSVWSTSNIFEQFRQGWVQVIQSLPKKCLGKMRRNAGSQAAVEKLSFLIWRRSVYSKTTHQHELEPLMRLTSSICETHLKWSYLHPKPHPPCLSCFRQWPISAGRGQCVAGEVILLPPSLQVRPKMSWEAWMPFLRRMTEGINGRSSSGAQRQSVWQWRRLMSGPSAPLFEA